MSEKQLAEKFSEKNGSLWDFSCLGYGSVSDFLLQYGSEVFVLGPPLTYLADKIYLKSSSHSMERKELDENVDKVVAKVGMFYGDFPELLQQVQNRRIDLEEFEELLRKHKAEYLEARDNLATLIPLQGKNEPFVGITFEDLNERYLYKYGHPILPRKSIEDTINLVKYHFRWRLVLEKKDPEDQSANSEEFSKILFYQQDYRTNAIPLDLIEEIQTESEDDDDDTEYWLE